MEKLKKNNCLVAVMNNKRDFEIAQTQHWYRIPVRPAPLIVKNGTIKYLAFYQTSIFGQERFSVRWYGEVENITIAKRAELLPQFKNDINAGNDYYKIEFADLKCLTTPIISQKGRRILFIPTTEQKLFNSKEINFLFNDSPLEEVFWNELVKRGIAAERQMNVSYKGKKRYYLDFAIFCKHGKLDIECDSKQYHSSNEALEKDIKRNNCLESIGWSVLRFKSYDIYNGCEEAVNVVNEKISEYGGVKD